MSAAGMPDPSSRPRRPPAAPPFDPAAHPWRYANLALAAVPADQLAPDLLRGVLSNPGDWPLDPLGMTEYRHPGREGAPVLAAVLIPLVARPDGVRVMLTQRTAHLHNHAG